MSENETSPHLPEVGGNRLTCSLAEFERRCRIILGEEQRESSPDNHLIALLCDAVRLCREHLGLLRQHYSEPQTQPLCAALARNVRLREEEALLYDAAQAVITTLDTSNQYETIRKRLKDAAVRAALAGGDHE